MRNLFSSTGTALALVLALGAVAHADPVISMQALEGTASPFNQPFSVPLFGLPGSGSYVYDDYTINYNFLGSIAGAPSAPQGTLATSNISVEDVGSNGVKHTLTLWITETGLTMPQGLTTFQAGFTTNTWTVSNTAGTGDGIESVTEKAFVSPSDATDFTGTSVGSTTFTNGTGALVTQTTPINLSGTYSETVEYVITSDGYQASSNNSIDLTTVPEPGAIAVLGVGLIALGALTRRSGRTASPGGAVA